MLTAAPVGELAWRAGGNHRLVVDAEFAALLCHIGCTGFAVEQAHGFAARDRCVSIV
jgi:hypothetical protein